MINLPAGFDGAVYVSDLLMFVAPFLAIAVLFVGYRIICRCVKNA